MKHLSTRKLLGSGCGSVVRAVASNTSGLRFESSHWQDLFSVKFQLYWKDENKIKEGGIGPFKKLLIVFEIANFKFQMKSWYSRYPPQIALLQKYRPKT